MKEQFLERMKVILKDEFDDFVESLNHPQEKAIYLNPLKPIANTFIDQFNLSSHHLVKNGYYFDYQQFPLGKLPYFDCGLYYIQEPSAMIVASLLNIQPNDYILDMCAAPGGKTCYVASHLNNTGLVIANDINPLRAQILSSNVERFGLKNTIVTNASPSKITSQLKGFFDKIILDAPCSGEGMFRKLDQAIDTWSQEKVLDCAKIQKELVDCAYEALKENGVLIYSTCTYSLEENEQIVDYILKTYPNMSLIPIELKNGMSPGINHPQCCRLYPHKHKGEGHFIALFKKEGNHSSSKITYIKPNISKSEQLLLNEFYSNNLTISIPRYVMSSNSHLYEVLPHFPKLDKVKILRTGLYLGECKKGRFEPSYALAHSLQEKDVIRSYNFKFDDINLLKYQKGETLEGNHKKGYGLILVDHYSLSFYKESNNIIKNLIPKGLRKQY